MKHISTKKFGPFSCAFRQPLAKSHCRLLHGYGLVFQVDYGADVLDDNGWVIDFGGLKQLKAMLEAQFDHKLIVAADDPHYDTFVRLYSMGLCDMITRPRVGIESFARYAFEEAQIELERMEQAARVKIVKVECWEHTTNSACYIPSKAGVASP